MCDKCEWKDALSLVGEIESEADDVPERGEDFAAGVVETATSIGETIEQRAHVTEAQVTALENMLAGLQKWTSRGD